MNICKKFWFIYGLPVLLSGCGGESNTVPQSAASQSAVGQYDYTLGSASSLSAARSAVANWAFMSLTYDAPNGSSYSTLNHAHTTLNAGADPIAAVDTEAASAWVDGWTGKGVKIGIADSFNTNHTKYSSIIEYRESKSEDGCQ